MNDVGVTKTKEEIDKNYKLLKGAPPAK